MLNFPIYEYVWFGIKIVVSVTILVNIVIDGYKYTKYQLKEDKKDE